MRRRSRPSMRGSPISIGGSWPSSTIERSLSVGPAARAMRAAEVVTFALVRSLAVPALAVPLVPAPPRPRNAPAGASRPKPWLLCGGRAVAAARSAPIIPRLGPGARAQLRLFCKNNLTPRTRPHISARPTAVALWRPARRRDFGTISRSAPPCWEAGAGRFRSSRFAAWPRNSGLRGGSRGASGSSGRGGDPEGERKLSRRYLTIASEGRETWAAGSLRGFVVWVGLRESCGLAWATGSEETTDGHVSKFIALLR